VSISEKETSGVGTDLNSNPPITPSKPKTRAEKAPPGGEKPTKINKIDKSDKIVKRSNSGNSSSSSSNSRRQPILQRIASAIKLKSPDSAVGSSIGQYDAGLYHTQGYRIYSGFIGGSPGNIGGSSPTFWPYFIPSRSGLIRYSIHSRNWRAFEFFYIF